MTRSGNLVAQSPVVVDNAAIAEVLRSGGPAERVAEALVGEALSRRTNDNATVLVIAAD